MRPFIFENPPLMDTPEGQILGEYLGRQFEKINQSLLEAQRATRSGHAGLWSDTPVLGPVTVTPTPTKIVGFNQKLPGENGATANLANSTISYSESGIWAIGVQLEARVTPITQNDTGDVVAYFYDETAAEPVTTITSGTSPRYGSVLTLPGLILTPSEGDRFGHEFALYLATITGSPDVTIEQINVMDFYTFRVSNFEYNGA